MMGLIEIPDFESAEEEELFWENYLDRLECQDE